VTSVDERPGSRLTISPLQELSTGARALAALRESEEKLRGLFELSPLGIALNDMGGRFVEFNDAFCRICGYTAEELRSLDYWALTPKKYAADEQRQLDVLARTGQYGPYEKEYVHKDGRHIPLRLNGILVTGRDGEKYIWSIVEDITDQKRAERLLREQGQFLSTILDNSSVGITLIKDRKQIWANPRLGEMFGYRLDEITDKSTAMFFDSPDAYDAFGTEAYPALAAGGRFVKELELQRRDGSRIWTRSSGKRLDPDDPRAGSIWIIEDITDQKVAQRRLEAERQRFSDFSSSSADWFWEMDAALRFTYLSPNFESVYGLKPQLVLGRTRAELLATDNLNHPAALAAHLDQIGKHLAFRNFEYRIRDATGEIRWILISGLPVFARDGVFAGYRGLGQIITRQKQAEQALRESEERFRTLADFNYDWEYWRGTDRRIIYSSNACEGITGYTAAEFVADPELTTAIVHPEDLHLIEEHYHHFTDRSEASLDFRILHKNGGIRWIAHGCRPVLGPDGEFRGRRVSNRDITDRKRIESELANTRESLSLAMEATSLSLWDYDIADGVVLFDNHWADLVGGAASESFISVHELGSAVHPEDAPRLVRTAVDLFKRKQLTFQEEFRFRTPSGSWKWLRCSGKVIEWDANGRAKRAIGTNLDISDRKAAEEEVQRWAFLDRLTNLPNRRLLEDRLHQEIAVAHRERRRLGLLYIDLDRFKPINDDFGHDMGDWLLQAAALRMRSCLRDGDTVARMGGDEFVALLPRLDDIDGAVKVAQKIRAELERPFIPSSGITLAISASIGVAAYPDHAVNAGDLLRCGDVAMYCAKKAGRNGVAISNAEGGRPEPADVL